MAFGILKIKLMVLCDLNVILILNFSEVRFNILIVLIFIVLDQFCIFHGFKMLCILIGERQAFCSLFQIFHKVLEIDPLACFTHWKARTLGSLIDQI